VPSPSTPSSAPPDARRSARGRFLVVGILGALIVAGVGAWALATTGSDAGTQDAVEGRAARTGVADVGEEAPDFELETLDGETVRLSDLRGQPVVVNFWASWCNPCREEFPLLAETLDENADADLAVVGVTYRDIESDSRDFVDEMDATWPQAIDDDSAVARAFGVRAIPVTFFVDADGVIAARLFGFSSPDALEEPLDRILTASRAAAPR
jgi:cytochrome c biogenesis protein CcmG, thiol:disulfide interchange protein DsbE